MRRLSWKEFLLTLPSLFWLTLFFLIPTLIIFVYSFKPADLYGGVGQGWTLETFRKLYTSQFFAVVWRTFWVSSLTTLFCLALALPVGYQIAASSKRWRYWMLMMIVIPSWSSFLIRIFAWKTLLHPEGGAHYFLYYIRFIDRETTLLYNSGAVLLVMVYTFLTFAILPIYSSAVKFNFQLMEAALDLGASRLQAFLWVFIPGIKKGILTAVVMVFIPALGMYVIPDLVGGIKSEMIGNKITQKIFVERNLPQASAISFLLALAVFVPMAGGALYIKRKKDLLRNRE